MIASDLLNTQRVLSCKSSEELSEVFSELIKNSKKLNKKFTQEELIRMDTIIKTNFGSDKDATIIKVLMKSLTRMYGIRQQKCMLLLYNK